MTTLYLQPIKIWAVPRPREVGLRRGEIWDPLITFERKELSASNLVQRWRTDPACIGSVQCLRLSERLFIIAGKEHYCIRFSLDYVIISSFNRSRRRPASGGLVGMMEGREGGHMESCWEAK